MSIKIDPENNEARALFDLADFAGQRVLEIGCGDGRLTWRYAGRAAHVTAIDAFSPGIERARANLPDELRERVEFHNISFEAFAAASAPSVFDSVILSWSLCCMEPAGMVHALENIHRLLKPGGSLIDIHPFAEAPLIEIHQGGKIAFAEPMPAYAVEDTQHAEDALAHVIQQNWFAVERASEFDFWVYAATVIELRDLLAEADAFADNPPDEPAAVQEEELAARVEELMRAPGEGVEVAYHDRVRIARMRPEPVRAV